MASSSKMIDLKLKEKKRKKVTYFREIQQELKKVTWTTKEELIVLTKIVVSTTFLFGVGIYLADLLIRGSLGFIQVIARFVAG